MNKEHELCPICKRPMVSEYSVNEHHLIPKSLKGKEKVLMHRICHQKIHSVFTERELMNYFHTIERIIAHAEMRKFIKWVQKKDPDYYQRNISTQIKRQKRKYKR